MIFRLKDKKGASISLFVIIALVLAAGVIVYFLVAGNISQGDIPLELQEVFTYYQSCIESETQVASSLASYGGGRIDPGEYVPGSEFAPFSSQLNFLGAPVDYWFYISGNGVVKENVPDMNEIENEMESYIEQGLLDCDFDDFYDRGFNITLRRGDVVVDVKDSVIETEVFSDLVVEKNGESARKTSHSAEINSNLGKFYDLAVGIYGKQRDEAFLEDYAIDTLYNYAPVDGVEIQCEPKVWLTRDVFSDLKNGLESNFRGIKFGDKEGAEEDKKYFVVDANVNENVQVLYSREWPTKIEVFGEGVDDEIMLTDSVGTQQGLGIIGFCYVPYHFVYDLSFPVMIQIFEGADVFQFPVVVVVDNNVPREAKLPEGYVAEEEEFDLCEYRTEDISVNIYDINLERVDAEVSYECFNQRCRVGESRGGSLSGVVPACVNGYLNFRAEGYAEKKQLFSSNEQSFADVVLDREYDVDVSLIVGGTEVKEGDGTAIVSFIREDGRSASAALPEINNIKLSEGSYEVRAYVYGSSSITIPATTKRQCTDVPREGILGFFGSTQERCFDIEVPETQIENALIGGGSLDTYILDSQLQGGKITIRSDRLPSPNSIEELGENFALFDGKRLSLEYG
ncbi:MAG: hypothetical protein KC506_03190 [Nanoarchaeota archaeon]|nr:hypothetical protein [Nanoarchaeota archaeon]